MAEPIAAQHPPVLVIAGMHRSGTSLVASLCQGGGIHIGDRLLGANSGNEAGHFEDLDFHRWHERVLRANGLGPEGYIAAGQVTVPDGLRREAEELVRERRGLGRPWGWKNPRTTLLLDFWLELLPEAVFLGMVRPPWEVVDSLFRRGDEAFRANPPFALAVWRHYNQALLAFAEKHPERTLVRELARVVGRPDELFHSLRDRFGVPVGDPPDCFKAGLLHPVQPLVIPAAVRHAAAEDLSLYESLCRLDGSAALADAGLDRAELPAFDALLMLWAALRSVEAEAARSEATLREMAQVNARLTAEVQQARVAVDDSESRGEGFRVDRDRLQASLAEQAARQAAEAGRLATDLEAALSRERHLDQRASELAAQLAAQVERQRMLESQLADELAARAERQRAFESEVARLDSRQSAAAIEREELQAAVVQAEARLREREAAIDRLRQELAERTAESGARADALATAAATVEVLRGDVERLEAACRDNIRFRRELDAELVRMTRSNSWRLTTPLRHLRRSAANLPARALDRLGRLGRRTWRRLPLSGRTKQRLREFCFTRLPWVFRWTASYREWRSLRDTVTRATAGSQPIPGATATPQRPAGTQPLLGAPDPAGRHAPAAPPENLRVIAMHLPQFHRIPENDAWWGEGFTEWTNVRRARPLFRGHAQPEVPHPDIGYYDLLEPGVLERQAEMARQYGIHGFCYYHYWFDGRRLLEQPLERLLATGRPDFPFCLCWANENWTRAWDGLDREVLVAQRHTPESDARFIRDLIPFLRDHRYIRVEGRPLVAVYRAALLPDPARTAATWRQICRAEGIGEIHLAAVRSFDKRDPREFGFDAAIQFPPLLTPARDHSTDPAVGAEKTFRGSLFEYEDAMRHALAEATPGYTLYRGVMPAWDNTPRRQERGTAWINASPERYGRWLRETVALMGREQPPERRLVFVNAWNEWAEGAHLEPDVQRGYRHLEETAAVLGIAPTPRPAAPADDEFRLLVISHDAHLAGAQMVTLRTVQQWRRAGLEGVRIVCVGDGVLRPAFAAAYPTTVLEDLPDEASRRRALLACADFAGRPPTVVYSSTVVNGPVLEWIRGLGMPIVTHAHELQKSIERWAPGAIMEATCRVTDLFMAAAPAIRDNLVERHGIDPALVHVVPAHIDCDLEPPPAAAVAEVRRSWNAGPEQVVVFGCGTTDWRKGPDLFCEIAARALAAQPNLRFAWAGGDADYHRDWLADRGLADKVQFLGTRGDVRHLLHAADLFLLSSREDPMPLVALEAAATGLPVVCFAGAGDIPTFVGDDAGVVVPMEDVAAATAAILALAGDPERRRRVGGTAAARVRAAHDSRVVAAKTLALLRQVAAGPQAPTAPLPGPLVSVIVPNYQHADYLPQRLESIVAQDVSDIEIILLDDCSADGSRDILEAFVQSEPRARLISNATNSGSAFRQWRKGLGLARGRYIWIAESDDAARPGFLPTLVGLLDRHPEAVLAYCQSEMIDERGRSLGLPLDWTADLSPDRWRKPYLAAGRDELAMALVHKNTIPNVSAVVFRNTPDLAAAIESDMRLCGDWLAYVRLCGRGDVAYSPEPLNLWRQRTSHSRTRPPGELEWQEGQRVIREATTILGLDAEAGRDRLAAFRQRCEAWLAAAGADLSAAEA
jgi:glycosyltransferase involved in cell wall biosynthesis